MSHFKIKLGMILAALLMLAGASWAAADTPPANPPGGSTLDQRIAQRKAERGTSLSTSDTQRVIATCRGAQGKLRIIENNEVAMLANRSVVYNSIDGKLWIVIGQLKLANQDTFQLEKQHQTLVDKTANFQAIAANYKQALDDTLLINCQADPNGFKALLDTARIYNDQLHSQAGDSHDYITNTIKPTLSSFVQSMASKPASVGGGNQ